MHSPESLSLLLPLFSLFILDRLSSAAADVCVSSCDADDLTIKFPFRLESSPVSCGYPGFELSCKSQQRPSMMTILTLPDSGDFAVRSIDYMAQTVLLNDPDNCLPSRLLDFTLAASPLKAQIERAFTLLNCSNDAVWLRSSWFRSIPCMSRGNYTVVSLRDRVDLARGLHSGCEKIATVNVPVHWDYVSDLHEDLLLTWERPDCNQCVADGGDCGWKNGSGLEVELTCRNVPKDRGLPRSAKYGIIIGVGIPGVLCLLGLGSYVCHLIGSSISRGRHHPSPEFSPVLRAPRFCAVRGLDGQTIESYPKTMLGASRRLPKPNDNTCPICLCEYKPKETLRTIPECSHYFHVDCIDVWLEMNSTCPLCRNSPNGSSSGASLGMAESMPESFPPSSPSTSV